MLVVVKRPRAPRDLLEIWQYIAEDSEDRADAFIDRIDKKIELLSENPGMGRERPELAERVRSFPVGQYVVFYRTLPDGLEIVRVLHGSRDIEALFH